MNLRLEVDLSDSRPWKCEQRMGSTRTCQDTSGKKWGGCANNATTGCSLEPVQSRHGPICKYAGVLRAILLAGRCCQWPATQDGLLRRTSRFMGEAFWAGCFSD